MAISSFDDFPCHQTSEYIRHPATSDRNFYDRYYFNLHGSTDEVFAIFGLGQYPNLGTTDAFIAVTDGERQRVVRASRPLEDRMDLQVGPLRIEIVEPLHKVRFVCEPNEWGVAMDCLWTGQTFPFEEPRQYLRSKGKVVFDTQRFAQLGRWEGTLTAGDTTYEVTPDRWGGSRDRSWGVRPVGEKEPDGIRADVSVMPGMWNYMPIDFGDHSLVYMLHETNEGERRLEEAVRVWPESDGSSRVEWLGRPEHEHRMTSGTRVLEGSTIRFPEAGIELSCTPLLTNFVSVGTGYGIDPDWRHGMWQGPDLVDHVGRFEYDGKVGFGLYEHGFFGPYNHYGLMDRGDLAP